MMKVVVAGKKDCRKNAAAAAANDTFVKDHSML